jgi:hypothetical protein
MFVFSCSGGASLTGRKTTHTKINFFYFKLERRHFDRKTRRTTKRRR